MKYEAQKTLERELDERTKKLKIVEKKFSKLNNILNKVQKVRDEALIKLLAEETEIESIKRLLSL
jgi:hypothetical protein